VLIAPAQLLDSNAVLLSNVKQAIDNVNAIKFLMGVADDPTSNDF